MKMSQMDPSEIAHLSVRRRQRVRQRKTKDWKRLLKVSAGAMVKASPNLLPVRVVAGKEERAVRDLRVLCAFCYGSSKRELRLNPS
jgi:hypothetical protein